MKPIVWTIAGSDSSGGAGIQADLKTFHDFSVHGCSVITALTAQNSLGVKAILPVAESQFKAEIAALAEDLPASVIKLGMQGSNTTFKFLQKFLQKQPAKIVFDPVMSCSYGQKFFTDKNLIRKFLPQVNLFTPNIPEAEFLLQRKIADFDAQRCAAQDLLNFGAKAVYLKGGHAADALFRHDYFTDGTHEFYLSAITYAKSVHGTGCVFSSAIAACLANNYCLADAVVIARMYIQQGIRLAKKLGQGSDFFMHAGFPHAQMDLPYLSAQPILNEPSAFKTTELGIYPIVDSSDWVLRVAEAGIKTIQLRIKHSDPEPEISRAQQIAERFNLRLFINDYWQLAVKHKVYGVHLGQQDLETADLEQIRYAGLRLGISTHCFYEVARAHSCKPSYMACGPIFPTTSKIMPFAPQGLEKLRYWRKLLNYPLVAIGGINAANIESVRATGVEGLAMISAISQILQTVS